MVLTLIPLGTLDIDGDGQLEQVWQLESTDISQRRFSWQLSGGESGLVTIDPGTIVHFYSNSSEDLTLIDLDTNVTETTESPILTPVSVPVDLTSGDDVWIGTDGNDHVDAGDGNDTLTLGSGTDTVLGGDGDDIFYVDSNPSLGDANFTSSNLVIHYDATDFASLTLSGSDITGINDLSTDNNDGSASGSNTPTYNATGLNGQPGMVFDGVNDVIAISDDTDINTSSQTGRSAFVALNTGSDVTTRQVIYEQGGAVNGYNIYIDGGKLYVGMWRSNGSAIFAYQSVDINPNENLVVGFVYDGVTSSFSMYAGGELIGTSTVQSTQNQHSGDIGLGAVRQDTRYHDNAVTNNGDYFEGTIGEFVNYSDALTDTEARELSNHLNGKWDFVAPPGADTLTGGTGADTYVWDESTHDSVGAVADRITDFNQAEGDNIDLSGFSVAAVNITGYTDSFSNVAGELIWYDENGTDTRVRFDVDGDGVADWEVVLEGVDASTLSQDAFGFPSVVSEGGDLDETIDGTSGNDNISGFGGNDTINGLGGNDTIYGFSSDGSTGVTLPSSVAHLRADDSASITQSGGNVSNVVDLSGRGNNGFQSNAGSQPSVTTDTLNGRSVFTFDGVNDHLDIADSSDINLQSGAQRTISMVLGTSDDITSRQVVYEQGGGVNGFNVYIEGGKLYGGAWKNSGNDFEHFISVDIATDSNYMITTIFDAVAGTFEVYVNGQLAGSLPVGLNQAAHSGDIAIGGASGGSYFHDIGSGGGDSYYFKGTVAEFYNFNVALTEQQQQALELQMADDWGITYGGTVSDDDILNGGDGNDVIYGNQGDDMINGDDGNDTVFGGTGTDTITGGDGADVLNGDSGDDTINGNIGGDVIHGGSGMDTLYGDEGNDTINGNADNDTIYGGDGNDTVNGGGGNDTIHGGIGSDILAGSGGNDVINGDDGADTLQGNAGNDTLNGGNHDDTLIGGSGDDLLNGDAGNDTYDVGNLSNIGLDTINDSDGVGQIRIDGTTYTSSSTLAAAAVSATEWRFGDITLTRVGNNLELNKDVLQDVNKVVIENFDFDATSFLGIELRELNGISEGDDIVTGTTSGDTIDGLGGNDLIFGDSGDDTIYGNDGDDDLYGGAGWDTLHAGRGNDILRGGFGRDTFVIDDIDSYGTNTIDNEPDKQDTSNGSGDLIIDSVKMNIIVSDGDHTNGVWSGGGYTFTRNGLHLEITGDNPLSADDKVIINNFNFIGGGFGIRLFNEAFSSHSMVKISNDNLTDILVSDLNSDGNDELVFTTGSKTSIYDDASGVTTISYRALTDIVIGDQDNDGYQDIYLNMTDGLRQYDTETGAWTRLGYSALDDVMLADLDNDGALALIYDTAGGTFYQDDEGNVTRLAYYGADQFSFADLNGDNNLDLVLDFGHVVTHHDDETGAWDPISYRDTNVMTTYDWDGDGRDEVFLNETSQLSVHDAVDDTYDVLAFAGSIDSFDFSDLDGDGLDELVIHNNRGLHVVDQDGSTTRVVAGATSDAQFANLDGDINTEMVFHNANGLWLWDETDELQRILDNEVDHFTFGDFNGDGFTDIAVATNSSSRELDAVGLFIMDGQTRIWDQVDETITTTEALVVADVDGDNQDELFLDLGDNGIYQFG